MMQERKLTARSVIASTLLGVRPPRLSAAVLVRAGSLFEIPEGTIRTALSRMLAVGELVVVEGRYELAGVLLARAGRQTESRTAHPSRRWDGQWRLAIVAGDRARSAADRLRVRTSLRRAHFAELREGVWTRPADRSQPEVENVTWFVARPEKPTGDPAALAARLWPLDDWTAGAMDLMAMLERWQPALDAREADALAQTFLLDAAVLRHLQEDPLLPLDLLPRSWRGDDLREAYESFDEAFKATWRSWYRSQPR